LTALEGLSADAVAQRLAMRLTAVFKAKSRIQQMLREEIARLEAPKEQHSCQPPAQT
jgi:RNA polymerase sigma-70 factor (ECF subfamily)